MAHVDNVVVLALGSISKKRFLLIGSILSALTIMGGIGYYLTNTPSRIKAC